MSNNTGKDIGVITIGSWTLDSTSYNSVAWVVSSQCKNKDAAVKFLNMTYTDPEIVNLIVWGIEGRDYVLTDKGQVRYPEGLTNSTVPYTCSIAAYYMGTQWLAYVVDGQPEGLNEKLKENVRNCRVSNAMGFQFDLTTISNECSAISTLMDEYMPGFITGSLDLDTEYPVFLEQLYAAGLQTVIDAKQAALDTWAVENGKK